MKNEQLSVAVCVHLYYLEMFEEIATYLDNFEDVPYDLFITMPQENESHVSDIRAKYPDARIIIVENVGFDIYPFLQFLQEVDLNKYDVLFKLHSKKNIPIEFSRNGVDLSGTKWRDYMFQALLGTPARVKQVLRIMERHPHIGMLAAQEVILQGYESLALDIDLNKVESVMFDCGMRPVRWEYVAGSVFAVRPKLLNPLRQRKYQKEDFPPYYPRDWNSLPYCLERVFGCMVSAQGMVIGKLPTIS